jgi:hypothetical protein
MDTVRKLFDVYPNLIDTDLWLQYQYSNYLDFDIVVSFVRYIQTMNDETKHYFEDETNWDLLSTKLPWKLIQEHLHDPLLKDKWVWDSDVYNTGGICDNKTVMWEDFYQSIITQDENSSKWSWTRMAIHPNVTMENILNTLPDPLFKWDYIDMNPNVIWPFIKSNPELFPDISSEIMLNEGFMKTITLENIEDLISTYGLSKGQRYGYQIINSGVLERQPDKALDFVMKYPQLDWTLCDLAVSSCIPLQTAAKGYIKCYDGSKISLSRYSHSLLRRKDVDEAFLRENIRNEKYNWQYNYIGCNSKLTWDIIKDNLDLPWDPYNLMQNKNITFENAKEYLQYIRKDTTSEKFDSYIRHNKNMTWDILQNNPFSDRQKKMFASNPNMTLQIFESNRYIFDESSFTEMVSKILR